MTSGTEERKHRRTFDDESEELSKRHKHRHRHHHRRRHNRHHSRKHNDIREEDDEQLMDICGFSLL
ncbi:hypothetical protein HanRHA438_Chr09g0425601 [Helianthus annuus]|nr:hypothetical protein HanXRQr2_Chr09g0413361 [Helianthus annuus]KAJ0466637.1 hypothetical protein HanIR_Chr14g0674381 [Helianthus annuus]KAJ0709377.1 hypothetical protein HanLR1_Chr09g0339721 [Helianthus annuus]KAJ0713253.1 hypothetical protein HanOQP8_Chr09g0343851 [Helianthus annuus]KAJ0890597.1 hypothetical protein HanRHA438_Chr09g0425601 [Helianthus annuus]